MKQDSYQWGKKLFNMGSFSGGKTIWQFTRAIAKKWRIPQTVFHKTLAEILKHSIEDMGKGGLGFKGVCVFIYISHFNIWNLEGSFFPQWSLIICFLFMSLELPPPKKKIFRAKFCDQKHSGSKHRSKHRKLFGHLPPLYSLPCCLNIL